jgi:hypothetical protein
MIVLLLGCHVFADGEIPLTCDDLGDCGDTAIDPGAGNDIPPDSLLYPDTGDTAEPPQDTAEELLPVWQGVHVAADVVCLWEASELVCNDEPVLSGEGWTSVSATSTGGCATDPTGKLECWGDWSDAPDLESWIAEVAVSEEMVCALGAAGIVQCWDQTRTAVTADLEDGAQNLTVNGSELCVLLISGDTLCGEPIAPFVGGDAFAPRFATALAGLTHGGRLCGWTGTTARCVDEQFTEEVVESTSPVLSAIGGVDTICVQTVDSLLCDGEPVVKGTVSAWSFYGEHGCALVEGIDQCWGTP